MDHIEPALLRRYIANFYGYGSVGARYWFVGMEEGGDACTLPSRLKCWSRLREQPLVDLLALHECLDDRPAWFGERPPIQSTWGKLIRLALAAEGREITSDSIRAYQRDRLGRSDGESALLELMPLPSPNTSAWPYASLLPELESRATYSLNFRQARIDGIRTLIDQHRPPFVIFYGLRREWPKLLNVKTTQHQRFDAAHLGSTRALFINHATAFGARNKDFEEIGRMLRS